MVNLQEVLDPLDVFRKVTGIRLEDVYNLMLTKGWTLGSHSLTADARHDPTFTIRRRCGCWTKFWRQILRTWWFR